MFKDYLKNKYREILPVLADKAVEIAESMSADGDTKKQFAVNFILKLLPASSAVKVVLGYLLNEIISDAVEFALRRLKKTENVQYT